ncbi:hypothetical protein ALP28_200090 [Pseudomonas savastanoi pv. nerii]|nr:hypothetical protein ALP28_200090 [Pseudomonas savastanoi pv. nerii]
MPTDPIQVNDPGRCPGDGQVAPISLAVPAYAAVPLPLCRLEWRSIAGRIR